MAILDNPGKIVGVMALGSLVGLALFGVIGFFFAPHSPQLVDSAVGAFKDVFLVTSGVKAGLSIPKTDPVPPTPTDPAETEPKQQ